MRPPEHEWGTYKDDERIKLTNQGYEIVCCVDDLAKQLNGLYTGYAVKVPNMLYE